VLAVGRDIPFSHWKGDVSLYGTWQPRNRESCVVGDLDLLGGRWQGAGIFAKITAPQAPPQL
jgi:hypothetical protein